MSEDGDSRAHADHPIVQAVAPRLRVRGTGARARRPDARRRPRSPTPTSGSRSRCSTGTAWSPARPAPARPRPCSCWPSSSAPTACRSSPPTSRATSPAWRRPGEANEKITARTASVGQQWTATGFPVEYYALGGQGTGIPLRVTMSAFGPTLLSKVLGLNDTQESSLGLVFHYADKAGLPLLDLADLRAVVGHLTSDEGKPDLKELGGLSSATAGVILRELIAFPDQGADAFFGEPEFESADLLQVDARRQGPDLARRAAQPAGPAGGVLDVPDVAARRPVPRPARGRRRRQAQAGVLLRRGAPAVQRRLQGVPRPDRPDRAADPVQGRRRLLRDPEPDRRTRRGARPARLAGPAPAPRAHPQRRQGAQGDRQHLPERGVRRPRRGDHQPRHRRGGGHRDERARRADAGRLDPAARPGVADGADRRRGDAGHRRREPALARSTPTASTASRPARSSPPSSRRARPRRPPRRTPPRGRRRTPRPPTRSRAPRRPAYQGGGRRRRATS